MKHPSLTPLDITRHPSFLIVCACMLILFTSFSIPPVGIINETVLIAVGELLAFAAGALGIDYHYNFKYFNS